jgi:hypothetical protein
MKIYKMSTVIPKTKETSNKRAKNPYTTKRKKQETKRKNNPTYTHKINHKESKERNETLTEEQTTQTQRETYFPNPTSPKTNKEKKMDQ